MRHIDKLKAIMELCGAKSKGNTVKDVIDELLAFALSGDMGGTVEVKNGETTFTDVVLKSVKVNPSNSYPNGKILTNGYLLELGGVEVIVEGDTALYPAGTRSLLGDYAVEFIVNNEGGKKNLAIIPIGGTFTKEQITQLDSLVNASGGITLLVSSAGYSSFKFVIKEVV